MVFAEQGESIEMKSVALLVAVAVPLAACGSKPDVEEKNASVEEVARSVREARSGGDLIRPGKWQSTVTIEEMAMPGMPPDAQEQMKRMLAQTRTSESCVTPEEVKKPSPDFFAGNDQCRYDHFTMGGGRIDAEMRCSQEGATQVMEMAGTYSPDAYSMRMTSRSEGGGAAGTIAMRMKVEAKRVGDCTEKES